MNILEKLEQARAELAALEIAAVEYQDTLTGLEADLEVARRKARDGGTLAAVVKAQGMVDASRGLLDQHRQDVTNTRAHVAALEAELEAARLLSEGQDAHRLMLEAQAAHDALACQTEAALASALSELAALSSRHEQARARLGAALRATVATAEGRGQLDPYAGRPDRLDAHTERQIGPAFLSEIDPSLTVPGVLNPWGGAIGIHEQPFPLLSRAVRQH